MPGAYPTASPQGLLPAVGWAPAPAVGTASHGATLPGPSLPAPFNANQLSGRLVPPEAIEAQRAHLSQNLDQQLDRGEKILADQVKAQSEHVAWVASRQKEQFNLHIDEAVRERDMALMRQHDDQVSMLQALTRQQKEALDRDANLLVMEYQHQQTQKDILDMQYQYQVQHCLIQQKYLQDVSNMQNTKEARVAAMSA